MASLLFFSPSAPPPPYPAPPPHSPRWPTPPAHIAGVSHKAGVSHRQCSEERVERRGEAVQVLPPHHRLERHPLVLRPAHRVDDRHEIHVSHCDAERVAYMAV